MKNSKALYLLLTANAISQFAQGITMIAIPWYFVDILNQPSAFGWIYAAATLGTLLWSLYAGTLIDRHPRKNIFLAYNASGFIVLGSVAAFGFVMGGLGPVLPAAVFCFTMFLFTIHFPSVYAFAQEITEKQYYTRATSMIEVQGQATNMIGGAVAAVLLGGISPEIMQFFRLNGLLPEVEAWHIHEIFALDASTYAIAFGIISFVRYVPLEEKIVDEGSVLVRLRIGFSFLRQRQPLFIFGIFSFSVFVIVLVFGFYLLPLYVDRHLEEGPEVLALQEVLYSFGAVSAGVFTGRLFRKASHIKVVIWLTAITAVSLLFTALTRHLVMFCAFNLILGMMNAGTRIMRISFLFNHIPNHIIGRASGVFHMINIGLRFSFITLFALPFFSQGNNVVIALLICSTFVGLSVFPLLAFYHRLAAMKEISDESP